MLPYYAALLTAIGLGVAGQLLFKSEALRSSDVLRQLTAPLTLLGFAIYGLSAVLYVIALRRLPVSTAFPSVSLSYIAVALMSHALWQEPLGWSRWTAMALILCGVLLLNVPL
jgi:small multidrug resistance pump